MNCTTHHNACDCREAALAEELERLRDSLHHISTELLVGDGSPEALSAMSQFAWRSIDGSASVDPVLSSGMREARKIMFGGEE